MAGLRKFTQWLVILSVLMSLTAPIAALAPLMASDVAAQTDTDLDGLSDDDEVNIHGTDPNLGDTDGDSLSDGDEVLVYATNPTSVDSDGDNVWDGDEVANGTNPNAPPPVCDRGLEAAGDNCVPSAVDADADGLTDYDEIYTWGTNPDASDSDGDVLSDFDEVTIGSNPNNPDTDGDDLLDGEEVLTHGTSPTNPDTDGDGVNDGYELFHPHGPLNPLNPDSDGDGFDDGTDINPGVPDRDQDDIDDADDNCPEVPNPDQQDDDGDAIGNVCDDTPWGETPVEVGLLSWTVSIEYAAGVNESETTAEYVSSPGALPADSDAATAIFVEIIAPATVVFPATVCMSPGETFVDPASSQLFHWQGTWVLVGEGELSGIGMLCSSSRDELGIFAIAEQLPDPDVEPGMLEFTDPDFPGLIITFETVSGPGNIWIDELLSPLDAAPWDDPSGYIPANNPDTNGWSISSDATFTGATICITLGQGFESGFGPAMMAYSQNGSWVVGQVGSEASSTLCTETGSELTNVMIGSLDAHPINISFVDENGSALAGELNTCISLEIIEAIFDYQEFGVCDTVDDSPLDGVLHAKFPVGTYSIDPQAMNSIQGLSGHVLHPDTIATTIIESSLTSPTYYVLEALIANTTGDGDFTDPATGVTITFANFEGAGITTVTVDSNPPALPDGFDIGGALFFDIDTTAAFNGDAFVCLPYDPSTFADPDDVKLLHFEDGAWVDVTFDNSWGEDSGTICGYVSSFSPFAIAQSVDGSTNVHILTQGANGLPAPATYVYLYTGTSCASEELGYVVASGYTDATGRFEISDIESGGYCAIEAGAPTGYGNNAQPNVFVTVDTGETATVTFTFDFHPPDPAVYGLVRLNIVDGDGYPVMADSCAVISPAQVGGQTTICDELPVQPNTWLDGMIDIYVTGSGATLTSYQPPVMWQLSGSLPAALAANPGEVIEHDVVLAPTGNGSVWVRTYVPGQTSAGVPGAVFSITDAANCSGTGTEVAQVTTALLPNQPEIPASALLELAPGDYCAEFVSAPAGSGYVIVDHVPFSVSAGSTTSAEFGFQDTPPAHLRVFAEGASGIPAAGAAFDIYSATDCDNLQDIFGGFSTEATGQAVYVNIPPGTYCVVHTDAPNGFGDIDPEAQLVTAVAGQTVDVTFTYDIHPPDPAVFGLVRVEVITDLGDTYTEGDACVTISPAQLNGQTTICDVDPSNPSDHADGFIDIYVTASGTSIVSLPSPLLWQVHASSSLPMALSVTPGGVVNEQITIEPTGQGLLDIVTHALPAVQLGAKFDIREGSDCLDTDPLVAQVVTNADRVVDDGQSAETYVFLDAGDYCVIQVEAPAGVELHYMTEERQPFTIFATGSTPMYFLYLYLENTPPSEDPVVVTPPGAPSGTSITFPNVTVPGVTTIVADTDPPALPSGFTLGGAVFYEIDTTASFSGSLTICLPYNPGSFTNPGDLELLHHDGNAWQDVTVSNDTIGGIICGSVTSLSPFAIAEPAETDPETEMVISGFQNPVLMGGQTNVREGGKVVNLRFTVTADGVNLTDPSVVSVSSQQVDCVSGSAIGNAVSIGQVTHNGKRFIAKWKTPEIDGCYTATATTTDGASITAKFELEGNPGLFTLDGFLGPVSMDAVNELEGGKTVNVRFFVYRDEDRYTGMDAIAAFGYQQFDCDTGAPIDGFVSLQESLTVVNKRFQATWETPKHDWCLTFRAEVVGDGVDDGDVIEADYKLFGNSHLYELGDGFLAPLVTDGSIEHEGGRTLSILFRVTLDGDVVPETSVVTQLDYVEVNCDLGNPIDDGMTGSLLESLTFAGSRFQAQWSTPEINTCFLITAATANDEISAVVKLTGNPGVITIDGFLNPVLMGEVNAKEGGTSIALRFRVYRDEDRMGDLALVESLTYTPIECGTTTTTGAAVAIPGLSYTGTRFDATWTTPEIDGCFLVTATAVGGVSATAEFELWGNSGLYEVSTFLSPVLMDVPNVYAGGTRVWLRFAVTLNGDVVTDLNSIASLTYTPVDCSTQTSTGASVTIGGLAVGTNRFQVRWTTPTTPGCYVVTATTTDGDSISAIFELD